MNVIASAQVVERVLPATRPGERLVVGQLGQTLDGRIATITGESRYINGACALDHLHRIRAEVDAVLVGVGTVMADDPQLNVRRVDGPHPVRVVLDPNGRMPASARCLDSEGGRVIRIRRDGAAAPLPGAEDIPLPAAADGGLCVKSIVAALEARGLHRILVEGGARTLSLFMDAGMIDRLHILVAPMLIGSGRPGLELRPEGRLNRALRPDTQVRVFSDGDVLFDCDMRRQREASA